MIPATLPPRAVRRVECAGCGEPFAAESVTEVGGGLGGTLGRVVSRVRRGFSLPSLDPSSRAWQLASVPIAAALVIGGLLLIQGDDTSEPTSPAPVAAPPAVQAAEPTAPLSVPPGDEGKGARGPQPAAEVVRGSNFSLALPTGWEKVNPPSGATFAAVAPDGGGDVTLWITEDAGLEFPAFVSQSVEQLGTLAPDARVCSRTPGPTPETTSVTICATTAPDEPASRAILRADDPYRYYLATTLQPDAGGDVADGLDLITTSFATIGGED